MKSKILLLILMVLVPLTGYTQVTIPNSFTPFTVISADEFNENFTAIADGALNRSGGSLTGNLSASNNVTIDGADISDFLDPTGKLIATSTDQDSIDIAGGMRAGTGNVAIITTAGQIAAISSTYFADLSGANLTGLNAANITGTFGALNGSNLTNLTAANLTGTLPNAVQDNITRLGTVVSGTLGAISGANLTNLNASNIASGTVPTARLGSGTADDSTFLRGDNTWATVGAAASVPTGAIMYFNAACPSGYAEFTNARGNLIVGLTSGGTLNTQVGTPFSNQEARTHTHDVAGHTHTAGTLAGPSHFHTADGTLDVTSHDHSVEYDSVQSGSGALVVSDINSSSPDVTGNTSSSGTGSVTGSTGTNTSQTSTVNNVSTLPYIQLRACAKS